MIFLKLFNTHSQYEEYRATTEFVKPNISRCIQENELHYVPKGYDSKYLTFVIKTGGDIKFSGSTTANTLDYSKDNGGTWTTASRSTVISAAAGDKIIWKGTCSTNGGVGKFSGDTNVRYDVEGNIMSLVYGDNFKDKTNISGNYAFSDLFFESVNVVNAKNMILPPTNLSAATYCYAYMFKGCTSLKTAPSVLPATTLSNYCYLQMFYGCISLIQAPELPATSSKLSCYQQMFRGCTSLKTAPELHATTFASACYNEMFYGCTSLTTAPSSIGTTATTTIGASACTNMFKGCTSLTTAPQLPAKTLYDFSYQNMFLGCTSLTKAPELPATTFFRNCYYSMFSGCTSLTTAPSSIGTTATTAMSASACTNMFKGCTALTRAPELPVSKLATSCYEAMFSGCTNLNYIKAMFTTAPSMPNWVNGVAASGTFVMNSAASWNTGTTACGVSSWPCGWTVQTASS